jgi:5'-nucleotidase (lipoprotein e(P4) family)
MGLAGAEPRPTSKALEWVTKSREYRAVCLQTYAAGWANVQAAARKESGAWAIVMDLDETVLNNSQYQVELDKTGASHTQQDWGKWVARSEAGLVPGAKEFIEHVHNLKNGRIIFISNRFTRGIEATRKNLIKRGLTVESDIYLLRRNREDTKVNRREEVFKGTGRMASHGAFKVLAWFGDAAHDFPDDPKLKWGTHKFMLPNPVYGNW